MLIFQDERKIHPFSALARPWAAVGQQPHVPTPGKNEQKVVYGGQLPTRQADLYGC